MIETRTEALQTAQLDWSEDGAPISRQFDDIYFSKASGIEETSYVFLGHNSLPERLSALAQTETPHIAIGETGFGTGLNFLCAWRLRDQLAANCHLNFTSVEKFPLEINDLIKALALWPELKSYADQLISQYPVLNPGWHRISFNQQKVDLTLYFGDALAGYTDYQAIMDAWFLDGFAPSKNEPMWSKALLQQLARLSSNGTTFSTFSAAAQVREGLKTEGFKVERVKGFANKRHMLKGTMERPPNPLNAQQIAAPWFVSDQGPSLQQRAVVIGGGLAGSSAAISLARRGWQVTLFEKHPRPGAEASGNRQGILYNKLPAEPNISSEFYTAGYLYSLQQLPQLLPDDKEGSHWQTCGVLQLANNQQEQKRQQTFITKNPKPEGLVYPVSAAQATELAGVNIAHSGLFFPGGGWASPAELCARQLDHPNIETRFNSKISGLKRIADRWLLLDSKDQPIAESPVVIYACAGEFRNFEQTRKLPLKSIRGQTTDVPAHPSVNLKTVLCGKGYIGPAVEGRHYMGATFNLDCQAQTCREVDHRTNLEQISGLVPELAKALNFDTLNSANTSGRVGFRCTTPDYLPLIGPVPDHAAVISNFAQLRKDSLHQFETNGHYLPGIYISIGHGSKGLISCPIGGEILAACIEQSPFPLATTLLQAVHPCRFLIRDLIRNKV